VQPYREVPVMTLIPISAADAQRLIAEGAVLVDVRDPD